VADEADAAEAEAAAAPASAISAEEVSALLEKNGPEAVRPFDFGAQRINHTQLPMLATIAKSFADRAAPTLSALLNRPMSLEFTSTGPVRASDLQASFPTPGVVAVMRFKPLPGSALMRVDPSLLMALLDAFFGGSGQTTTDGQAAVSGAAQRFLALMLKSVAADFTAAWTPVSPLELELVKQETNPRLLPLGNAQDSLTVVRFTGEFESQSGAIDWILPEALLAPIRESLATDNGKAPTRKQEAWAPALGAAVQELEVELRAVLAKTTISLRELVSLSPGDIIPIDAPQDVTVFVGDVALRQGRFGVSEGRNALKIISGGLA
jgi:flagellar motor switch protein FliM